MLNFSADSQHLGISFEGRECEGVAFNFNADMQARFTKAVRCLQGNRGSLVRHDDGRHRSFTRLSGMRAIPNT